MFLPATFVTITVHLPDKLCLQRWSFDIGQRGFRYKVTIGSWILSPLNSSAILQLLLLNDIILKNIIQLKITLRDMAHRGLPVSILLL